MESRKTISDLNNKVWYRFLKVIYILFFIIVFSVNNTIAFDYRDRLDYNKTLITCNIGDKKSFNLSESGTYFSSSDFRNYTYKSFFKNNTNETGIEKLINKCIGTDFRDFSNSYGGRLQNIYDIQRYRDIKGDNPAFTIEQVNAKFDEDKVNDPIDILIAYKYPLFDISLKYSDFFLTLLTIGNFVIALVFVIGQRVFYYITIGTLIPKKYTTSERTTETRFKEN